jgi:Histidine kinase-, DNA gyrase B-, and HSP90-like ATPase
MIQKSAQYEVTSTIPTENKVAMGIRMEDMGKVMGILTDLYKNKLLAMIREYSTNALDAIIDAGLDPLKHPVKVTLPTAFAPFLTIEDEGVGLTETDIREVYSQYGRSTKDTRNDVVGMLGLGCKSALTYGAQFTVTSRKDGTEIVVVVSREQDGSGSCNTIASTATDKPNGTEVRIAINRSDYMRAEQLANDFFQYWTEGTVLVNGSKPAHFEGLRVTDSLFVTATRGASKVVMGNVAYPAPELDDLCPAGSVVAFVPIGAVDFPPSREALQECQATTDTLNDIRKRFNAGIKVSVQTEIDKAATPADAIQFALKWDQYIPGGGVMNQRGGAAKRVSGYKYNGTELAVFIESDKTEQVQDRYDSTKMNTVTVPFVTSTNEDYYRAKLGRSDETNRVYAVDWMRSVWVTGYTPAQFNAQHKKKLRKMCEIKGITDVHMFVMARDTMPDAKDQPAVKFIPADRILDWDSVSKLRLDPVARRGSSGRIPGSYDLYTEDGFGHGIEGSKIRRDQPILYFHGNQWQFQNRHLEAVRTSYKKFTVVLLTENRIEKFKRNVPETKTVHTGLSEKRDEWVKSLTDDQRNALWLADDHIAPDLKVLDAAKVKDPKLKRAIRLAGMRLDKLQERRTALSRTVGTPIIKPTIKNPLTNYPLFNRVTSDKAHLYAYLNWHYDEVVSK